MTQHTTEQPAARRSNEYKNKLKGEILRSLVLVKRAGQPVTNRPDQPHQLRGAQYGDGGSRREMRDCQAAGLVPSPVRFGPFPPMASQRERRE